MNLKELLQGRRAVPWGLVASTLSLSLLVSGCNTTPKEPEAQWSAERLYSEAKEESSSGNYERAAKLYERLEGRASGTVLAQQAQIERAYIFIKPVTGRRRWSSSTDSSSCTQPARPMTTRSTCKGWSTSTTTSACSAI